MFRHLLARRTPLVLAAFATVLLLTQAARTEPVKKLPVPTPADQAKAEALIRELFEEEFAKAAKDPVERARLAVTFLQEARDTKDYPAGRYVLLRLAKDLGAEAGEAPTALQAIEQMALEYEVRPAEAFDWKIDALAAAGKASATPEAYQTVVDTSLLFLEEALNEDEYDAALRLVGAAEAAARRLRQVALVVSLRKRQQEVHKLQQAFAPLKPFADALRKDPSDAKANLVLGKYQAWVRGNWDKGLAMLARSSDAQLASLAKKELAQPAAGPDQLELAEGWWSLAGKATDAEKVQLLLHAYTWYQQALASAEGPARKTIEARMKSITDQLPPEYRIGEIAQEVRRFDAHPGPVFASAFSPDGRKVVTGCQDGAVRIWDARTGKELRRLDGHSGTVWTVAFSPDGRRVVSGSFDNTARIWDVISGRELRTLSAHSDYVRSVAFSRDGRKVLTGGDDRVARIWNADTGEELGRLRGHDHFVWSVAFSPDGKRALTASLDRSIRLWDMNNGKELRRLEGHDDTVMSVVFSPDGRRALSGSTDRTVRLWDLDTGKEMRTFRGHVGHVYGVAFSPDGRRALSVGQDGTLRVWDVDSGKEVRRLDGHQERIWFVAFSPDGRWAVTSGNDHTARLWGSVRP